MTFTTKPTPTGASTTTVKRLAAVEKAISSRVGSEVHPAEVERVLAFFGIGKTKGRGQPHHTYGTTAITTLDYERLCAMPTTGLLEAMGRDQ